MHQFICRRVRSLYGNSERFLLFLWLFELNGGQNWELIPIVGGVDVLHIPVQDLDNEKDAKSNENKTMKYPGYELQTRLTKTRRGISSAHVI